MKAVLAIRGRLSQRGGNILVYIVMIMVIFAVLGVAMVSLFSTSISSSATANDNRRALYLYESGYRYALSELTATGFSTSKITALNTTTYKLPPEGEFALNVFGPWFDSTALQDLSAGSSLGLKVVKGKLPPGFTIPAGDPSSRISVVNFDYVGTSISATGSTEVTGYSRTDDTHLSLTVGDDFVANDNERICLAVHPASNQTLSNGGDLTVAGQARYIFPKRNGAIEINRRLFFYRELSDPGGNQVVLKNLSDNKAGNNFPFNVAASDYAILSPANYYVIPEGRAGKVAYGTSFDYALGTYDTNPHPEDLNPDVQDLLSNMFRTNTSDSNYAVLNDAQKKLIFEKTSSSGPAQFATVWFKDTRAIGGQKDFCQQGGCLFGDGVRAFFLMTFTGPGDGFTFSLINTGNNTAASVGGDFQLGELLGFAGDGRTGTNPATYIPGTQPGLQPPKMAVEFDGFYNNSQAGYCADADNLKPGSRFDPDFPPGSNNGKDTVQYVFWASRNPVAVPCRNNPLYDDNRHNSQDSTELRWTYSPVGPLEGTQSIKTSPKDGTIYVVFGDTATSSASRLIAVDPLLGSLKWQVPAPTSGGTDFNLNGIAVDDNGNVYVGSDANKILARKPDGSQLWAPFDAGGQVESPMAISEPLNRIYFGANAASNAVLFALNNTTGAPDWAYSKPELGEIPGGVTLDPVADPVDGRGTLYFGTDINPFLYAVRTSGVLRWRYPSSTPLSGDILAQPVVKASNRDVIFATTNGRVYALPYSTSSTPTARWTFNTSSSMEAALAISPDGNTVYVGTTSGTNGGVLFALKSSDGTQLWRYPSSGSAGAIKRKPAVDGDGTIYFGSENGHVYALNPDAGPLTDAQRLKWVYPSSGSIGSVESEIEIGKDGDILFISSDGKLYSVIPSTIPPNLRNLYLTDTELQAGVSGADWFGLGTWAVRVEVDRNRTPNANGKFEYTLRTWMRRCTDASACSDIVGTLYGNTRLRYNATPSALTALPMRQTIELDGSFDSLFNSLLFGFTSATGGATQTINISQFQLSFIRTNDPVVTADPSWP